MGQTVTRHVVLPEWLLQAAPDKSLCKPHGMYSMEHVDLRKLKKLILTHRLAPCWPQDERYQSGDCEECPICSWCYPSLNTASCCSACICTECFVQCQTSHNPPGKALCPFCKHGPFSVRYLGYKPHEQLQQEKQERQAVAEALRRQRQGQKQQEQQRQERLRQKMEQAMAASQDAVSQQQTMSAPIQPHISNVASPMQDERHQQHFPPHQQQHATLQRQQQPPPQQLQRAGSWLDGVVGERESSGRQAGMCLVNIYADASTGMSGIGHLWHCYSSSSNSSASTSSSSSVDDSISSNSHSGNSSASNLSLPGQMLHVPEDTSHDEQQLHLQPQYVVSWQPQALQQQQEQQAPAALVPQLPIICPELQQQSQPQQPSSAAAAQLQQQQQQQSLAHHPPHVIDQQPVTERSLHPMLVRHELLPQYVLDELAGLDLAELDQILLEQAMLASMRDATAGGAPATSGMAGYSAAIEGTAAVRTAAS